MTIPNDSHRPDDAELRALCAFILDHGIQWPMREADFAVCKLMWATGLQSTDDGNIDAPRTVSVFIDVVCEYAWDHLMGEPDDIEPAQMAAMILPAIEEWYAKR